MIMTLFHFFAIICVHTHVAYKSNNWFQGSKPMYFAYIIIWIDNILYFYVVTRH